MQIVDMHCDTISELLGAAEAGKTEELRENCRHVDLRRMKEAGYLLQNFALYVNQKEYPDVRKRAWELLQFYQKEIEKNSDWIESVTCMADIERNRALGKMSAMLTLEEGAVLGGSEEVLKEFYSRGVRMITLTWNHPNEIGFPHGYNGREGCHGNVRYGLTKRGFEIVEAMEELGVIVDVSHLSDAGFYDVLKCTKKPFVASHSNARAIGPVSRNMTDEMIRLLGKRGGVMGLNFYPPFLENCGRTLSCNDSEKAGTIASVIAHAKHIVKVGGIDVLGLGSDFDGMSGHAELPGVQAMPLLAEAFTKAGFTASEIDKIFCKNVLRLYREVLG